jgi:hypothetical protein
MNEKRKSIWMFLGYLFIFVGVALVVSSFLEGGTTFTLVGGVGCILSSFFWFAVQAVIDLLVEIKENTKK